MKERLSKIQSRQKARKPNIMYKTLGIRWVNQTFCPASAFVTADSDEARNPQRFIHVNVSGNYKKSQETMIPERVFVKNDNSEKYLEIVRELYNKAIDSDFTEKYSAPFVLFCATSLEYLLNNIFINYTNTYFEDETQKKYAELFITLGVGVKLLTFLPIVSGNKFQWDTNTFEYKTLTEIITKRNKIAHGKDFYQGLKTYPEEDGSFSISLKDLKNENFLLASRSECDKYLKAFENFIKEIYERLDQDKLSESTLIIPVEMKKGKKETLRLDK